MLATLPAPLFDRKDRDRAFVPTKLRTAAACSGGPGRPSGRRQGALPWTAANPAAGWRSVGIVAAAMLALSPTPARAEAGAPAVDLAPIVAEAAQRFALPPSWIAEVMRRESGFQLAAVSRAGALGLMQIMPRTYGDLQSRYGLGADPLAPRDNIMAGAAYLRELYDRFGQAGFLAAYNAGPARYGQWLITGKPLPAETQAYTRRLDLALGLSAASDGLPPSAPTLFVALTPAVAASPDSNGQALAPRQDAWGLFVPITSDAETDGHGR
jgi:hypothetical protein